MTLFTDMYTTTQPTDHAPIGHSTHGAAIYWHWIVPSSVAIQWKGGQVDRIIARWICGGQSTDVTLCREPPDEFLACAACEATRYRKYLNETPY